jgi:hypothetical protein
VSNYLGTVKGLGAGVVVALLIAALYLSGCATQTGLFNSSVNKVCTGWYCYLTAPRDLVNTRCVDRKSAWKKCQDNPNRPECAGAVAQWDDGTPRTGPGSDPAKRARCCTVLRPKNADDHLRYWIWIGEGDEVCVAHEHGHIEIYEKDGFRYIAEHHRRLHGFGLDKGKKRL